MTDEHLRELLGDLDPAGDLHAPDVLNQLDLDTPERKPRWVRPTILAAAAAAVLGLVGVAVIPRVLTTPETESAQAPSEIVAADGPVAQDAGQSGSKTADPVYPGGPSIIRTASLLSSTEDPQAAADEFLRIITPMGGRVTSQTTITEGSQASQMGASPMDSMMPMPYGQGPGVWLTVQVPAGSYEQALDAARGTVHVVRMEQTSDDVSAQVADVDARVKALRSSVAQLRSLMSQTTDISEIIRLENAISDRQSELDGLVAQRRELASSTRMSEISLTLMTPGDAATAVGEDAPDETVVWVAVLSIIAFLAIGVVLFLRRKRPTPTP